MKRPGAGRTACRPARRRPATSRLPAASASPTRSSGAGDRDIVFVPGLMSHLELLWESQETGEFFRRLATLGRLILFDKRDTGLSDRAPGAATLEERIDDVRAVMRAAGSERAVLFGYSEGAPMSILFAATYPERVSSLILGSAAARWFPAPDYPCGQGPEEMYRALHDIAENRWGQGDTIDWYLPSRAGSPRARQLIGRFERMAISPSAFQQMIAMIRDIDVRDVLPAIHVPTLVIQRLGDKITIPFHGRYLASHIAGARYFEQPGDHSLRFAGGGESDALIREIRRLPRRHRAASRTRSRPGHHPARPCGGQPGGERHRRARRPGSADRSRGGHQDDHPSPPWPLDRGQRPGHPRHLRRSRPGDPVRGDGPRRRRRGRNPARLRDSHRGGRFRR